VRFALTIAEGSARGKRFRFESERVSIGRGLENEVVLNDAGVSRAHARIERRGTAWVILDRGSANGTHLNGAPLAAVATLRDGDRIHVGPVTFEFRAIAASARHGSAAAARRSRLPAYAWWSRLPPPVRAGVIAGCALVAVAGSGTASWRGEPLAVALAPGGLDGGPDLPPSVAVRDDGSQPGPGSRLETGRRAPGAAREAYERGRRKLEERRIAPRNLYDAWKALTEARAHLDEVADPSLPRDNLSQLIGDCERDLKRQCRNLLFRAARFERYGQQDDAQQAWREVLLHFPGDDVSGCRKRARDSLLSSQPDDGGG
jgi:hypothetical protein